MMGHVFDDNLREGTPASSRGVIGPVTAGLAKLRGIHGENEAMTPIAPTTAQLIEQECDALKALLLAKNAKYGDSASNPIRIFSKASPVEQILVRIDDKLSRIARSGFAMKASDLVGADEDTVKDLIGYLILLRVVSQKEK
jgi:hypothetical protein